MHGALCMCYSGQCYLSAVIGQRSGNRGLCAQPCRLPYSGGYPLSLKDLMLAGHVAELSDWGVSSLKIEGRMKRPSMWQRRSAPSAPPVRAVLWILKRCAASFPGAASPRANFDGRIDREMFGYRQKEDVTSAAGVLGELGPALRPGKSAGAGIHAAGSPCRRAHPADRVGPGRPYLHRGGWWVC